MIRPSQKKPLDSVKAGIEACLKFISECQEKDGSFKSHSGNADFSNAAKTTTPFVTALLLICLGSLKDDPIVKKISIKSIDYLLSVRKGCKQASSDSEDGADAWTWNYWPPGSKEAQNNPVPEDLDDTFTVLSALQIHDLSVITGKAIASVTKTLTLAEVKIGGPYNTWLVADIDRAPWNDIDPVVNSTVSYFLKMLGVTIPSLDELMDHAIRTSAYDTRYYPSYHSVLYFISRSYGGALRQDMIDHILNHQKKDGSWGNILDTSMCISALIRLGYSGSKMKKAAFLLAEHASRASSMATEGHEFRWKPLPCYIEENKGSPTYAGSAALTASFVLEALCLYKNRLTPSRSDNERKPDARKVNQAQQMHESVKAAAIKHFDGCSPHTRRLARKTLGRIFERDSLSQIPLLPWHVRNSLGPADARKVTANTIRVAGTASVLGWLAYTIYDDILDEESDVVALSCANVALRGLTEMQIFMFRKSQLPLIMKIMNDIDDANSWERLTCRIKSHSSIQQPMMTRDDISDYADLSVLYKKSLGHAIGPLAALSAAGYPPESENGRLMLDFFRHYLVARQLNDDAHDWQDDLDRGFQNSVSSRIFLEYFRSKTKNKNKAKAEKDRTNRSHVCKILESRGELQLILWNTTIDGVVRDIFKHLKGAEKSLTCMAPIEDKSYFQSMIDPLRRAAETAVRERDAVREMTRTAQRKK